jgi:hypothetical protein
VLQPQFSLGAASVFVTASILFNALGIPPARLAGLTRSDLNPVNLYRAADRSVHLLYGRGVRFVNDLRVVYEIQSRLRPESEPPAAPEPEAAPPQPAPKQNSPFVRPGGSSGIRRENNRADEWKRNPSLLASAAADAGSAALAAQRRSLQ